MFENFDEFDISVAPDVTLHGHHAPRDPDRATVLLHGHPRTHTTWGRVAPRLADAEMSVVCPDLRGYGHSTGPAPDAAHEAYCDRAMAQDVATLMRDLGYDTWSVVGHDRGQGVAFRLALDAADQVRALVILDGVPIVEALERADARFAELWWHWFFFARPEAERVILADPIAWYGGTPEHMGPEAWAEYQAAVTDPATARAMLEDYRAGLRADRDADDADRAAGSRIRCPVLVAWSLRDDMEELYGDPVAVWREWADDVRGATVDSGHHMAEEAPAELTAVLLAFLRS